jgi:SAM-dependent methyltransferase
MINDAVAAGSAEFAGYYEQPRTALLDLVHGETFTSALEVGCGSGANLVELKARLPACRVTGVEVRPDAAAVAGQRLDQLVTGSVLDPVACDFPPRSFDLVILSHVLEHFERPQDVLARVLPWLSDGGRVLVALPNVRHVSVLQELVLHGDFRYRSSGIMDHTHLRFFTRRSAERFLTEQGLVVERCVPDFNGRKSLLLQRLSLGLASDFAAFAYNFVLRKQ